MLDPTYLNPAALPLEILSAQVVLRLDELGQISDERGKLSRTFLSPASLRANLKVAEWMHEAGLDVSEDAFGNLIGRRPGPPGSKTLVIGSHLDTVLNAGRFDGAAGVLLGIGIASALHDLPFGLEIVGFSDEEGVRFQTTYLGSRAYLGLITPQELAMRDDHGVTVADAVRPRRGLDEQVTKHRPDQLLGYFEIHIEQGPVLEAEDLPLGLVLGIAGQTRVHAAFTGQAGHAGTVPMNLRKDALAAAAEFILGVERFAISNPPLLATVGKMIVEPGAGNVIPGLASFTVDIRSPNNPDRKAAVANFLRLGASIAERRNLTWLWEEKQSNSAVACNPHLTQIVESAIAGQQAVVPKLFSGAGHDAVVMASHCPTAMLFVRCKGGLSHHPDEYASPGDLAAALEASIRFVTLLASHA